MKTPFCRALALTPAFILALARAVTADPLSFRIDEGQNINSFVRAGPVAAHLLLRSGHEPRILVAFPAGNSGVGLWFEKSDEPVAWTLAAAPKPVDSVDERGRPMHGIEFDVTANLAGLRPRAAVLSSIRVLRDYELLEKAPDEVTAVPRTVPGGIAWGRDRLDGAPGYSLTITATGARASAQEFAATGGTLRFKVRALTGEPPLTPLATTLSANAGSDARARDALAFLSYREKFLAGSWRFDTYFGRDTQMSALLLGRALEPDALESAIASVLDRLAPNGEVAHEEDIGEFAVLRNSREGRGRVATPIYDYGMVDDDFMLAPLAARVLLDDARERDRARAFLAARGADGKTRGAALVRNLAWLVDRTAAFARDPRAANLVGIKPGRMTGEWRDSEQGLARGRYAYDVNAALVPAALAATARLADSGLLGGNLDAAAKTALGRARERARAWSTHAPRLFAVDIPNKDARAAVATYAKEIGVDAAAALRSLADAQLAFHALSLDEQGRPIPVLNSDEGFRLLLDDPDPEDLRRCLDAILRPFPAGLVTDVGIVVANPALAAPDVRREFTRFAYHGTVVWSWQQALLAAGLERQSRRTDLPASLRTDLRRALRDVWAVISNTRALRTSELWSWSYANGAYRMEPFGRPGADVDESNAAQLWSTVYLGLTPP